jgi:hypothetical protein
MNRRTMLGVLGTSTAGLAALRADLALGADDREDDGGHDHHEMAQSVAKDCATCMNDCNAGFHHCYGKVRADDEQYAEAMHICVDHAEMCSCAAALCARESALMGICCEACAKSCDECIAVCEKHDDPEMQQVVKSCQKTKKSCQQMAEMMGGRAAGRRRSNE